MRDYLYSLATDKDNGVLAQAVKCILLPLSWIYAGIIRILACLWQLKPYQSGCKVVSVGNITLGGTGKTMLVEFIARCLKEKGHKTVILSRGYKRRISSLRAPAGGEAISKRDCFVALRAPRNDGATGDEPAMLSEKLKGVPVIVDADRVKSIKKAVRDYAADAVILDDGFQQWRIKKDLEIVAIDALNPFGNRRLLPRGILREPLSALAGADIFVLTKVNLSRDVASTKELLRKLNPRAEIFEAMHLPADFYAINDTVKSPVGDRLEGETVALFSGIGDPGSFEALIKSMGINAGLSFRFSDHYAYTLSDLDKIFLSASEKGITTVITTEKDAVRLRDLPFKTYNLKLLVFRITLAFKDEQRFRDRLLGVYSL